MYIIKYHISCRGLWNSCFCSLPALWFVVLGFEGSKVYRQERLRPDVYRFWALRFMVRDSRARGL